MKTAATAFHKFCHQIDFSFH